MTFLTAVALSFLLAGPPARGEGQAPGSAGNTASPVTPDPQAMTVTRGGSHASFEGPAEYFTGTVHVDMLLRAKDPSRVTGAYVTFEPGARSAWHTHPLGQHLVVTAGTGWVQQEGGERQEIRPGDVVWTPPGVKHWHGATATSRMTHLALQEALDGSTVEWLDKVSDEEYDGADPVAGPSSEAGPARPETEDTLTVAPALERFTTAALLGDVWKRPELSPRDRSLVTVAALVARNQTAGMAVEIARALDNAVTPAEISESLTHLAFYSGWPNALSAAAAARQVFTERGVTVAELPPASAGLLPLDEAAESQREALTQLAFYAGWPKVFSALPVVKDVLEKRP